MKFVPAKYFTPASRRPQDIRLEILHTMEAPEKGTTAEAVAKYFQNPPTKASAHFCIDNDSIVQCVMDDDIAYAAPGANNDGRQYELAGYAGQSATEWKDPFSTSLLAQTAILVAKKCEESGKPKTWLSDREVAAGKRGICDHATISRVYKKSSHWDCGPNFPKDYFIDLVRASELLVPAPTPTGGITLMADCVAAIQCPLDGGFQKLQADGAVFNQDCNHYYGSWWENTNVMIEARKNQPVLPFVDLVRVSNGNGSNYVIVRKDGAIYGPDFGYGIG